MPDVTTLCFLTKDAVEQTDSSFTFCMPRSRVRQESTRVALASCEFPMVQWTIEESWNRMYISEGLVVTGNNDTLIIRIVLDRVQNQLTVTLPRTVIPIALATIGEGGLLVETEIEHQLWLPEGRKCLIDWFQDARLVGGAGGDV